MFLPCYLFVIIPAPFFNRVAKNRHIKAFVDGVTAAATGAIAGAAFVIARRSFWDEAAAHPRWLAVGLCAATALVLWRLKRVPEPVVILAAAVLGIALGGREAPAAAPAGPPGYFRTEVGPRLSRSCASEEGCHGPKPTDSVHLDLRPARAWDELVDAASETRPGASLVVPGRPEESFLLDKLDGHLREKEGKRMPLDAQTGAPVEPQPPEVLELRGLLEEWIKLGAPGD